MKLTRSVTVLAIACTVLFAACSKKEEEKAPNVTVQTAVAQNASLQQVINTEAILFPKAQSAITPKITAPVKKFYVNRGSRVHEGQLLAVLENRDLTAAVTDTKGSYEQAQAAYQTTTAATLPEDMRKAELDVESNKQAYDAAKQVYDSRQVLFQQGAIARKDLDTANVALVQAKAQYDISVQHLKALQAVGKEQTIKSAAGQLTSAEGKYHGAEAQLNYSEIRSPIDGVVTDRPAYAGETPAPGTPLLTIMDTATVVARAHIPQEQAALLKRGDTATITAPGDITVDGKVVLVSPALDPNSTTVEVWIEAKNKDGRLRPGTTVGVQMIAKTVEDAIVVPASAVMKDPEGKTTVMVVGTDNRAHQKDVETGIREDDKVQITSGLTAGERVVSTGGYGLPDNTQVTVAESNAPEGAKSPQAKPSAEKD